MPSHKEQGVRECRTEQEEMKAVLGKATVQIERFEDILAANKRGEKRLLESKQKRAASAAPGPAPHPFVF